MWPESRLEILVDDILILETVRGYQVGPSIVVNIGHLEIGGDTGTRVDR
jgi:hypothetical protein